MNNQTNTTQNITSEGVQNLLNLSLDNYNCDYNYINAYHCYDRAFKTLETDNKKQVGFELEVQNTNYNIDLNKMAFLTRQNFGCLTASDSSIGRGHEIISDITSLDNLQADKDKNKALFKYLSDNDFTSHNASGERCGLHIHINRNKLVDNYDINNAEKQSEFIAKICILELIFDNFKSELKAFSRRNNFNYCTFLSDSIDTKKSLDVIKQNKDFGTYSSHSVAINLQHKDTIEFRIFRGTLEYDTLIASIQLCNNLVEIAKGIFNKTITNYKKLNWQYIIDFNADYEELKAYNTKRNIQSNVNYIDGTILERARQLKLNKQYIKKSEKAKALLINIDAYLTTHARRILKLKKTINDLRTLRDITSVNNQARQIKRYFGIETLKSDRYNLDIDLLNTLRNNYDVLTDVTYHLLSKQIDGKTYYYLSDDNLKYYTNILADIKKIEASEDYKKLHYQVRDLLRGGVE